MIDHQKEIADQRIQNLQSSLKNAEQLINRARRMLSSEKVDVKNVQKEMSEIQDFLLWASNQ